MKYLLKFVCDERAADWKRIGHLLDMSPGALDTIERGNIILPTSSGAVRECLKDGLKVILMLLGVKFLPQLMLP